MDLALVVITAIYSLLTFSLALSSKKAADSSKTAADSASMSLALQRDMLVQAERDSAARTRPYVYAALVPSIAGVGAWDIVVTNHGRTIARDVRITTTWPDGPMDTLTAGVFEMFTTPQALPPGASLRCYWHFDFSGGREEPPEGMPEVADLQISYQDDQARKYSDCITVRLEGIGHSPAPRMGAQPKNGEYTRKHVHEQLGSIAAAIRMIGY